MDFCVQRPGSMYGPVVTHQQDLYGTQDVHGASKGGAQVETEADGSTKLWSQRSRDHVVGASSWWRQREGRSHPLKSKNGAACKWTHGSILTLLFLGKRPNLVLKFQRDKLKGDKRSSNNVCATQQQKTT